jgi:hypothetical protein
MYRSSHERLIVKVLEYHKINFIYEQPLFLNNGYQVEKFLPDFTIVHPNTKIKYLWEHLGMLGDDEYEARWRYKKFVYETYLKQEQKKIGKNPFELVETTEKNLNPQDLDDVLRRMGFDIPKDLPEERYGFYSSSGKEFAQLSEWLYGPSRPQVSRIITTAEELKQFIAVETKILKKREFFHNKKKQLSKEIFG